MSRVRAVALLALVVGASSVTLVGLGLAPRDALLLTLAVGSQALCGGYLWRRVRERGSQRPIDPVEVLGMGLAIGTAASTFLGVLLQPWLGSRGWLLLPAGTVVTWLVSRIRQQRLTRPVGGLSHATAVGFTAAALLGVGTIILNLVRYPLGGPGPWTSYHPDMLFFEALSDSTGVFGSSDSIFMSGGDIRYHWFAYGWVGQLADTVGAANFGALTRLLPLVAVLGCGALVVSWTARYVNRWPVTVLAALLLIGGGYVGATNGTILNFDSPSQNLTTLWLVAALLVGLVLVRERTTWPGIGLLAVLAYATTAGKVSSGAVLVVPLTLAAGVLWWRRDERRSRAAGVAAAALGASVVAYAVVIAGSASPGDLEVLSWLSRASSVQGLNSSNGPRGVVLGTVALLLAMAARWWGLAWLVRDRSWRWQPDTTIGVGLVAVSVVPVALLSQGLNETWFALAASAPLSVLSAAGVGLAWQRLRSPRGLASAVLLGLAIVVAVPLVWLPMVTSPTSIRFFGPWIAYSLAIVGGGIAALAFGRGRRRAVWAVVALSSLVFAASVSRVSPVLADALYGTALSTQSPAAVTIIEDATATAPERPDAAEASADAEGPEALLSPAAGSSSWTLDEDEAAAFIRAHAPRGSVIVTNDTESYLVPALTKRRTYLSGAPYQATYGSPSTALLVPDRRQTSLEFLQRLDARAFAELCRAGVTWGWVVRDASDRTSWEPYASTVYENGTVAVLRIKGEMCP